MRRFVTLVRKHRAPNGALRLALGIVVEVHGRAVPESTERQTVHLDWFPHDTATCGVEVSQKAPSAKRCIKTTPLPRGSFPLAFVRKHRAPNGALRPCIQQEYRASESPVRKHQAPNGALRLVLSFGEQHVYLCQKAPSAKRCIKTLVYPSLRPMKSSLPESTENARFRT